MRFTPPPIVILTGGDPLMRDDIDDIIRSGTQQWLTHGHRTLRRVFKSGTDAAFTRQRNPQNQLSLDGSTADTHDAFAGSPVLFDAVFRGIEYAKAVGISFR